MRLWLDATVFVVLAIMTIGVSIGALWLMGTPIDVEFQSISMLGWWFAVFAQPIARNMQMVIDCDGSATVLQRCWAGVQLFVFLTFTALFSMFCLASKVNTMLHLSIGAALLTGGLCWWGVRLYYAYRRHRADQRWLARREEAKASEFAAWLGQAASEDQNRPDRQHSVGA